MIEVQTCWDVCEHCGDELMSQRSKNPKTRIFSLCGRTGEKCFETSAICASVKRKAVPEHLSYQGGWSDY